MPTRSVATRGRIPLQQGSGGINGTSRTYHYTRVAVTQVAVVVANWYAVGSVGESASGASVTITGSIEYPAGTFTQLTWGGATSFAMGSGNTVVSDFVRVNIPNNTKFFVRLFYNGATTFAYADGAANFCTYLDTANGDALESSVTDRTMSGSVTDGGFNNWLGPCAIIGDNPNDVYALLGSSRMHGNGDTATASGRNGDMGEAAPSIGPTNAYINIGVPSDSAQNFAVVANSSRRVALAQAYCNIAIGTFGDGDIVLNGRSVAQATADLVALLPILGMPYYQNSMSPVTTSTDSWATVGNQTAAASTANIHTWNNNLVSARPAGIRGVFDVASITESTPGSSGKWSVTGGANTADGTHANSNGYGRIKTAAVIAPVTIRESISPAFVASAFPRTQLQRTN